MVERKRLDANDEAESEPSLNSLRWSMPDQAVISGRATCRVIALWPRNLRTKALKGAC